jgi:cell shape-determining protein MreC
MFKQKHYLAIGAVTLVALLIFSLPPRATERLKLAIGSLFLPLLGLANTAQQLPVTAADAAMSRRELLQLTENLRRENDELKAEALQTSAIARENDQLRAALGWQRQMPWKLKLANVVMRDPANLWRKFEFVMCLV